MADLIRVKRGIEANLPPLATGEFGYCTDTKKLYIGGENENDLINSQMIWTTGKTMAIMGDSLSVPQYNGEDNWPNFLEDLHLSKINNYSVSGRKIAGGSGWAENIDTITTSADITVTFAGVNDFLQNTDIGTITDKTNVYFVGSLRNYISKLIAKFPVAKNYFVLLPKTNNTRVNPTGFDANFYRLLITCVCEDNNITLIDPYDVEYLNPKVASYKNRYYLDGVHLKTEGSQLLADFIKNKILFGSNHNSVSGNYQYINGANAVFTPNSSGITIQSLNCVYTRHLSNINLVYKTSNIQQPNIVHASGYFLSTVNPVRNPTCYGFAQVNTTRYPLSCWFENNTLKMFNTTEIPAGATFYINVTCPTIQSWMWTLTDTVDPLA